MGASVIVGSLESSDAMITITPSEQEKVEIEVDSIVKKQFGERIEKVSASMVSASKLARAKVKVQDRGALECTLRARLETALERYAAIA